MSTHTEDRQTRFLYASPTEERLVFFLVFTGVLALTYGLFFVIDFLPEKPSVQESTIGTVPPIASVGVNRESVGNPEGDSLTVKDEIPASQGIVTTSGGVDPYPKRIIFDTLDKEVPVLNPSSHTTESLDTALLSGAVRHPDSADFVQEGTIFLFGHSSYLPTVINKNFQAFNGIQKLKWGDTVRLQSSDTEYVYRVDRVYETSAIGAEIPIETGKSKLTLVTCDSFGSKSDRFVVEATLMKKVSLEEQTVDKI